MTTQATAAKPKTADMHPGPGFRVRQNIDRPEGKTIAGLGRFRGRTVVLIGNQDTIEVWDRERWHEEENKINEAAPAVARRLSRGGAGDTSN